MQKLVDSGKIKPDTLVALVGKTEGTGFHDDWGRVWADVALRDWTSKLLGVPVGEVAKHVIFVLSGGCPGVITPHIVAITREWIEVPDKDLEVGKDKPEVADELAAGQEVRRSVEVRADMERHRYLLPAGFVEREPLDPSDRGPCIAGESRRVQRKVLRQVQKSHFAKRRCRCVAAAPLMNCSSVT